VRTPKPKGPPRLSAPSARQTARRGEASKSAEAPDSRERIIAVASRLFTTGSFNAVGIAEICDAATVHKGTFYHFFTSKTELLLEVMERRVAEIERTIEVIAASDRPAERKIMALFAATQVSSKAEGSQIVPGHFLGNIVLEMASSNPPVRLAAKKAFDRWSTAIAKIVAQLIAEEKLYSLDANDAADAILGLLQGATIMASAYNDSRKMLAFGHVTLTLLRSPA
jgi:TetR/AcrR family transcriptional regulator, transcriptional repressor for nem operon